MYFGPKPDRPFGAAQTQAGRNISLLALETAFMIDTMKKVLKHIRIIRMNQPAYSQFGRRMSEMTGQGIAMPAAGIPKF